MATSKTIYGRVWFIDGQAKDMEVYCHELLPTDLKSRGDESWAKEHLCECYTDAGLRELLKVPEGDHQVIFTGTMEGWDCGNGEWDEEFNVDQVRHEPIPEQYVKIVYP